jgi:hypothetical protein
MAYSTHYLGHIKVDPPLNEAEFQYLTAFGEALHEPGPHVYDVPDNPLAPEEFGDRPYRVIERRDDVPDAACAWVPSCHGGCLVIRDDSGEHRRATQWLQWIYDHFLRSGALEADSGRDDFAEFSFDHRLDAAVAAHRSETGGLVIIRPRGDVVREEVVWPGEPEW